MKFINKNQSIKIRRGKSEDCYWVTLETGETMNLPEQVGLANGLEKLKLTEGQIGDKKVETKQILVPEKEVQYTADDLFFKELTKIKGIGIKTAKDIITWGTKEKLIEVIKRGERIPFRDDIEILLRRRYG